MKRYLLPGVALLALVVVGAFLLSAGRPFWDSARPASVAVGGAAGTSPLVPGVARDASGGEPGRRTAARIDAKERSALVVQLAAARKASRRDSPAVKLEAQRSAGEAPAPNAPANSANAVGETRSYIQQQIAEIVPLLTDCYERERAQQPSLSGKLEVRFTIEGEPGVGGIISQSEVTGGSLAERNEFSTCVRETMYSLKFAAPEAGGSITVAYPFEFETAEQGAAETTALPPPVPRQDALRKIPGFEAPRPAATPGPAGSSG